MSRHHLNAPILYLLLLTGCVTLPDNAALYQEPPGSWEVEQNNNRLRDMEFLIQKGRGFTAKQQAEAINPKQLNSDQQTQYNLLYAQIFLSSGEAEQALAKLALIKPDQLTPPEKIKFLQSQAFAYSLTGHLLESAEARISLDELLTTPSERKKNQATILETLGFLPEFGSKTKQENQPPDLATWIAAANILATKNRNPAEYNQSLENWKTANPEHPANFYLGTVPKANEELGALPDSIAVFLPESGPYADAAKAIKAGFLAAHNNQASKPILHFYDTEKTKSPELYNQAINEGAKLIVGPLNKDNIQALANSAVLTAPVLALNHIPNLDKANLYQFALSPIDDATELTLRAASDGHKRALVLVPDNELGKRVGFYLREYWQALGGILLEKQTYKPNNASDYQAALKKLLNLDENQNTNPTAAEVKRNSRQDADVLFLGAYNKEGRAINTQIKAQSNGVAVYALPNIYSGLVDTSNDAPLNGITFCDTPWLFNGAYNGELSMSALRDVWDKYPITYIRLIAMGIDAYHLAAKLPTLASTPYSGATGNLTLAAGNRIKRNLICAKFAKGQPEILGFAHDPKANNQPATTPIIPVVVPSP